MFGVGNNRISNLLFNDLACEQINHIFPSNKKILMDIWLLWFLCFFFWGWWWWWGDRIHVTNVVFVGNLIYYTRRGVTNTFPFEVPQESSSPNSTFQIQ